MRTDQRQFAARRTFAKAVKKNLMRAIDLRDANPNDPRFEISLRAASDLASRARIGMTGMERRPLVL